jgi:hypothetical protein
VKRQVDRVLRETLSSQSRRKIQEGVVREMQREMEECTFQPNLNKRRNKVCWLRLVAATRAACMTCCLVARAGAAAER